MTAGELRAFLAAVPKDTPILVWAAHSDSHLGHVQAIDDHAALGSLMQRSVVLVGVAEPMAKDDAFLVLGQDGRRVRR